MAGRRGTWPHNQRVYVCAHSSAIHITKRAAAQCPQADKRVNKLWPIILRNRTQP